MSTTTHTPGPWKVRDRTEVYAAGYFIGTTRGNHPEPESILIQDEANARLIAAAPELLAALDAVLAATSWHHIGSDALSKARAAITKATQP